MKIFGGKHLKQQKYKENITGKQGIQVRTLETPPPQPPNGEEIEITGRGAQRVWSHVDHYKDFDFY